MDTNERFSQMKFGRLPRKADFRDHLFSAVAPKPPPAIRRKMWSTDAPMDQGDKPQCVAFAGIAYLLAAPIRNTGVSDPNWLYHQCQLNDDYPGEDYDGTSVRGLFKVLKNEGYIESYWWAFDVKQIANWILTTGPVVVGTLWTESMMTPQSNGFIRIGAHEPSSQHAGHCYLLKGVNLDTVCPDKSKGAFRIQNSWGNQWGDGGCTLISMAEMQMLIREGGEACMSKEKKKN